MKGGDTMEELQQSVTAGQAPEAVGEASPFDSAKQRLLRLTDRARERWITTDLEQAARNVMRPMRFFAIAAVIGVGAVVATVYTPAYSVSVGGVAVGAVDSRDTFASAVQRVEATASDVLGYDYVFAVPISYQFALVERDVMPSALSFDQYLIGQVSELTAGASLRIDGQTVAVAADIQTLLTVLDEIKAPYINDTTYTAAITADIRMNEEYVATADLLDNTALYTLLTGGEGTAALSVQTVDRISYTEEIPFPIEEVEDNTMYEGETAVRVAGVNGQSLVTADVTSLNGEEQGWVIAKTETLTEPTAQVVALGTMERPWKSTGTYAWPVNGTVSSPFGYRTIFGSTSFHSGIDICTTYGSPIYAADGGTVTSAKYDGTYGNIIIITHDNGEQTAYAHCASMLVEVGNHVNQGQNIATVGTSGRATGPHCHFELRVNGTAVDPINYLM